MLVETRRGIRMGIVGTSTDPKPTATFWNRVLEPSPHVVGDSERRRVRLLSLLLLVLAVSALIGVISRAAVRGVYGYDLLLSSVILGGAFFLSRTRHWHLAAGICIVSLSFPSYSVAWQSIDDPELVRHSLIWLALPMFFSSFVLRARGTAISCGLNLIGVSLCFVIFPWSLFAELLMAFSVLVVTGALSIGAAFMHGRDRQEIERQLVERHKIEDELRNAKDGLEIRVKERTTELQQANERLRALFQSSPAAVAIVDQASKVTLWNPAAERIFGWTEEEVLGRPLPMVAEAGGGLLETIHDRKISDLQSLVELNTKTKSGDHVVVSLSAAPLSSVSDGEAGQVVVLVDVTKRERLEEQLRHSQKMEAVGQLAGGVAHDFNNLLTVINGYTEISLNELGEKHHLHADLAAVLEAGEQAKTLTRQLLAFGRRQVLNFQILDLNEVLDSMGKMLRRLVSEDLKLELRPGNDLWTIKGDLGQIEQVILNLVVNANDAMPTGGTLSIATDNALRGDDNDEEFGSTVPDSEYVKLSLTDTGEGMSPEIKDRVFEPFFTTKALGHGTGLGLATVYGIVTQSGGLIEIQSRLGQGTTFDVFLPRAEGTRQNRSPDEIRLPTGAENILVVEDETTVRELATRMIRRLGYGVIEAANGVEAISVLKTKKRHVDLVITDVVMPEMGGPELAERIEEIRDDLPVVFMSGHADPALDRRGVLATDVTLFHKPFRIEELAVGIRRILDKGAS